MVLLRPGNHGFYNQYHDLSTLQNIWKLASWGVIEYCVCAAEGMFRPRGKPSAYKSYDMNCVLDQLSHFYVQKPGGIVL